ncbi:MAG: glycosyltransferase family 39 protein [Candidatus Omnitrophica bacterium]|nr:glycosyltransferase family 39 protein [Candidatus Omnitrophota bacterium]
MINSDKQTSNFVRSNIALIFVVLLLGIILHLVGINQPFLGNFAQHQTDYATVVQRWLETGIDPFRPAMRFLERGEPRYFLGDLPLTMTLTALICKIGYLPIEVVGRGLSAVFFFLSLLPFYGLLKRVFRESVYIWWTLFFYGFSPLIIVYSQAFLLEVPAVALGICGYYCVLRGIYDQSKRSMVLSGLCFGLMLSLRIYYAPLLVPIAFLLIKKIGWNVLGRGDIFLGFILMISIPISWQAYAYYFGQAQGVESSLQDNVRYFVLDDPIMKDQLKDPNYFLPMWHFILNKIVSPLGFFLAVIGCWGLFGKNRKIIGFILFVIASFAGIILAAPRKFIEFDYYFIPLVPFAAVLAATAVQGIYALAPSFRKFLTISILLFNAMLACRFSISPLLIIPAEDRYVLEAAEMVRSLVPERSKVVTRHGSSTSFLYYTNRDGWTLSPRSEERNLVRKFYDKEATPIAQLEKYRSQGADYFALADKSQISSVPEFYEYLAQNYERIDQSEHSLVYLLKKSS